MAEPILDKLYRVSIGSERNYIFVQARDAEDLISFLADNYPDRSEIYGAKEITSDGSLRTVDLILHPLFQRLYAQKEEMGAVRALPAGVTMIDGKPWAVMLPTGGLDPDGPSNWNDLLRATGSEDSKCHWKHISSWCLESVTPEHRELHVQRGLSTPSRWYSLGRSSKRMSYFGYRPVLVPLDTETFEAKPSVFLGRRDGDMFRMGTLYMDGVPLANPQDPVINGDVPDYQPGATLHIGNSSREPQTRITWIKAGDVLIADRNLIKNISWDDLDQLGLARGPEHLQEKKLPLDCIIDDAQKRVVMGKEPSQGKDLAPTR